MEHVSQERRSSDINLDPNKKERRALDSGFKSSVSYT